MTVYAFEYHLKLNPYPVLSRNVRLNHESPGVANREKFNLAPKGIFVKPALRVENMVLKHNKKINYEDVGI